MSLAAYPVPSGEQDCPPAKGIQTPALPRSHNPPRVFRVPSLRAVQATSQSWDEHESLAERGKVHRQFPPISRAARRYRLPARRHSARVYTVTSTPAVCAGAVISSAPAPCFARFRTPRESLQPSRADQFPFAWHTASKVVDDF